MRPGSPLQDCRPSRPTSIRVRGLSVRLKLTEIFYSLQGEADTVGIPTVFIRLTGCPLRCQYCDTAYAFHGGRWWQLDAILERVREFGARYVCVTGGEPLAQQQCLPLLSALAEAGYRVSLETSGAMRIDARDTRGGPQDAGVARGTQEPLRSTGTAAAGRADQVRTVRPWRLRVEPRQADLAAAGAALPGAVLAESRTAAGAAARRLDSG